MSASASEASHSLDQLPAKATLDPRTLLREIAAYREPSRVRSVFELAITGLPFMLLWVAMWAAIDAG